MPYMIEVKKYSSIPEGVRYINNYPTKVQAKSVGLAMMSQGRIIYLLKNPEGWALYV